MKEIRENIEAYKEDLAFKNEEKNIDVSNVVEISYMLDENEVPQRYRILAMSSVIPNFKQQVS
jgi:hypothetical protein